MDPVTGKALIEESKQQSERRKNSINFALTYWYRNTIMTLLLCPEKRLAVYRYWLSTKNVNVDDISKCGKQMFYDQLLSDHTAFKELFGHDLPEVFMSGKQIKGGKTVLNLITSARLARELDAQHASSEGHYVIGCTSAKYLAGKWQESARYLISRDEMEEDAAEKRFVELVLEYHMYLDATRKVRALDKKECEAFGKAVQVVIDEEKPLCFAELRKAMSSLQEGGSSPPANKKRKLAEVERELEEAQAKVQTQHAEIAELEVEIAELRERVQQCAARRCT